MTTRQGVERVLSEAIDLYPEGRTPVENLAIATAKFALAQHPEPEIIACLSCQRAVPALREKAATLQYDDYFICPFCGYHHTGEMTQKARTHNQRTQHPEQPQDGPGFTGGPAQCEICNKAGTFAFVPLCDECREGKQPREAHCHRCGKGLAGDQAHTYCTGCAMKFVVKDKQPPARRLKDGYMRIGNHVYRVSLYGRVGYSGGAYAHYEGQVSGLDIAEDCYEDVEVSDEEEK